MDAGEKDKQNHINEGRRRISKAAAASPILASLASPSVWGAVCSVSGLQSGNISGRDHDECLGRGCTPGYWKNHTRAWPLGFSAGECLDKLYGNGCKSWSYTGCTPIGEILGGHDVSVFAHKHYGDSYNANTSIMYILQREVEWNGNTNSELAHWIAAVFNAIVAPDIYGTNVSDLMAALDLADGGGGDFTVSDLCATLTAMNQSGTCFLSGGNKYSNISCNSFNGVDYMYHADTGTCIPSCPENYAYDWATKTCVLLGQQTSYEDWCTANPDAPECTVDGTL